MEIDPVAIGAVTLALALGGLLKGVTGAGAPVIAVPVLAAFFDIRLAVILMVIPNMSTNLSQIWFFWKNMPPGRFAWDFAISGAVGAAVGTLFLKWLPLDVLELVLALVVLGYVALRIVRRDFKLAESLAHRVAIPVGGISGVLQGATGISAPVSVTFLNAMRLDRHVFIPTISLFFISMTLAQLPMLLATGLMTMPLFGASVLAIIPLISSMYLGESLARHIPPKLFDQLILGALTLLALRLLYTSLT